MPSQSAGRLPSSPIVNNNNNNNSNSSSNSNNNSTIKKQASISSFFTRPPKPAKEAPASPSHPSAVQNSRRTTLETPVRTKPTAAAAAINGHRQSSKRTIEDADFDPNNSNDGDGGDYDDDDDDEGPRSGNKRRRSASRDNDLDDRPLRPVTLNSKVVNRERVADRTSKYLFSSSPPEDENENGILEDKAAVEAARLQKERLHQKFVKKLGRPDSIAEIKRRNPWANDEAPAQELDEDEGDEDDETPKGKGAGKAGPAAATSKGKKTSNKLTPMEKQVLEIKAANPDTLLVVEVGYKYRFFGEDARVAARELGIVCIPGKLRYDEHFSEAHLDRFASASIPTHRLHVHVKRLVSAGHKVGVVRQLETAALKAVGDNRNAPFVRKLTNLYTKGTYIDDVDGLQEPSKSSTANTGFLLCITETKAKGWGTDEKVQVGFVAVQPATGDVIYDDFEDGFMRSEVETRLLHIAPVEFLIVGELSKATEKIIDHLSSSKANVFGDKARVERVDKPKTMAAQAFSHVSTFYAGKMKTSNTENDARASALLEKVLKLSENVTICLSSMITQMSSYGLEHVFDLTKYFQSFSARSHMLLNGTTLTSLEIYQNQTDHAESGSLFWCLNRTRTPFGKRLLRKWVGRPLLDREQLEQRVEAVEEIKENEHHVLISKLRGLLTNTKSDLEKSLIRIYYGKCTRAELCTALQTLQRIATEFASVSSPEAVGFQSSLLNNAIALLPTIGDNVTAYLDKINAQAASENDKYTFFRQEHETGLIEESKMGIAAVEYDLNAYRAEAAAKLKKKKVEYVTVGGIEYQIEVDNKNELKNVPASWIKISGTKAKSRFHAPEVIKMVRERDQHKESLAAACDEAFADLLNDISAKYQGFRDCVQSLALLDCLLSLAQVAAQPGYCKPTYTDTTMIKVEKGRHPMVEQLLLDAYVPNDISLDGSTDGGTRALLITGPNMGGKSSYVRSVALIAIMGQIGSYVPAESAELGMLDAVFTRMGAQDNMLRGESTFMVELSETSDIIKQATPRSLVILDELGRGTSTHDGVAIAQAVLEHMVRRLRCLTLFITHYQSLSHVARAFAHRAGSGRDSDDGGELRNVHMSFQEQDHRHLPGSNINTSSKENGVDEVDDNEDEGSWKEITFLYEVAPGIAHRSYGLNVARLARIPPAVLRVAAVKSRELEANGVQKKLGHAARMLANILADDNGEDGMDSGVNDGDDDSLIEQLAAAVEQL